MKKIKFLLIICCSASFAQIQTPQSSPKASINQTVGLTEVKVEYSRPAMRGRIIMGDLVPFGEIWRTGANANTIISFSDDVKIGGKSLKAGKYSIFSRPGISMWEVFFYTKYDNWNLPDKWDIDNVAAVVEIETQKLKQIKEHFTISIDNLSNQGATINLEWENTKVSVPFEVPTDEKTMASISRIMQGEPTARDYYGAAIYFRESGRDLQKAKKWISTAIDMDGGKYWMYRQQALILVELNEKDAAILASKNSLRLAKEAGNQDYVRLNNKSISKWSK